MNRWAYRDWPIERKLRFVIVLTASISLLAACFAFVLYDILTFRKVLSQEVTIIAKITGSNTASALLFEDIESASMNIRALAAQPNIEAAAVYTLQGELFATYTAEGASHEHKEIPQKPLETGFYFDGGHVNVFQPIVYDDEHAGTIYIKTNLNALFQRIKNLAVIMLLVLFVASLLAVLLSIVIGRVISHPILELAKTAAIVSEQGNYSLCAQIIYRDEVGQLVEAFNNMLRQIERRDIELKEANDSLEEKVHQRTAELEQATKDAEQAAQEARKAQEIAEIANRTKSEFLSSMSHELRTPLNAVLGYAQIFKRDQSLSEKQRDGVRIIENSADHLLTLINDILDMSKIEAQKFELFPTDFHLGEFLKNLVGIFEVRARQKQISFIYEPLSHLPEGVHADEKRLRQILINLLGNAVKFTDQGGICLKVGRHNGKIRFQVDDTGIGISEEDMKKVFEPFQQVKTGMQHGEGTGLGLAITKKLVAMMDGELGVRSILDRGSSFWVDLPLKELEHWVYTAEKNDPIIVGYKGDKKRILVIDDKKENRLVIKSLLEPLGFEVLEAENGEEGVGTAEQQKPDLIFMDLVMPKMDGFRATKAIRSTEGIKDSVIIAASASVFEFHQAQSREAGCNDFIAKPIRADMLLELLRDYLSLEWVFADEEVELSKSPKTEDGVEFDRYADMDEGQRTLPVEFAEAIFKAAKIGNIRAVLQQVEAFEETLGDRTSLTKELRELCKAFQAKKIRDIAQSFLEAAVK